MNYNTVSADFTFYMSNVFSTLALAPPFMLLPSLPHAFPFFHLFLTPFDLSAQCLAVCSAHFSASAKSAPLKEILLKGKKYRAWGSYAVTVCPQVSEGLTEELLDQTARQKSSHN